MSGVNDTYNPVLVKSFSDIFFSVMLENTGNCWYTDCYATLISTVVVLRTVTEFHVTLPIATDVPLSFHVTLR